MAEPELAAPGSVAISVIVRSEAALDTSIASLRQGRHLDIVEASDAVRLGPESNRARFRKGLVGCAEQHRAVIGNDKSLAFGADAEPVPFVCCHLQIGAGQLFATAVDDAIEPDVVLERVGA